VLDNLELLQTHQAARDLLEALRDSAFNRPGLRWVLCGARGIMRSAASSSRLQGVLAEPMELTPLPDEFVSEVIARRIEVFRMDEGAYAPVEPDGFHHLYEVGNRNLRNALKYCEDYALWVWLDVDPWPETPADKRETLEVWMAVTAEKCLEATPGVGPRAWGVFEGIVARGGSISPSDFADFAAQPSTPPHRRGCPFGPPHSRCWSRSLAERGDADNVERDARSGVDHAARLVWPEEIGDRGEPRELPRLGDAALVVDAVLAVAHAADEELELQGDERQRKDGADALRDTLGEPRSGWHACSIDATRALL
jgi:hypothetical protein